jgi:hypothetical protein
MVGQAQHPLRPFSKVLCLNANDGAALTVLDPDKMTIAPATLVGSHDQSITDAAAYIDFHNAMSPPAAPVWARQTITASHSA